MTSHAHSTSRRGMLAALAIAPAIGAIAAIEANLPSLWASRMAAHETAKKAARLFSATKVNPAWDAQQRGGPKVPDEIWSQSERLDDIASEAEKQILLTPAPDLSAVLWKMDFMFTERREGDFISEWLHVYTDTLRDDVARLAGGRH